MSLEYSGDVFLKIIFFFGKTRDNSWEIMYTYKVINRRPVFRNTGMEFLFLGKIGNAESYSGKNKKI